MDNQTPTDASFYGAKASGLVSFVGVVQWEGDGSPTNGPVEQAILLVGDPRGWLSLNTNKGRGIGN